MTMHATCVAVGGLGALLRGRSGSGKSDLALRLIDQGAELVADDQVVLRRQDNALWAEAPPVLAGRMEVRGIGILRVPWRPRSIVAAVFNLDPFDAISRLPEPETITIEGLRLPLYHLAPFEASAAAKVRLVLRMTTGGAVENEDEIYEHGYAREPRPGNRS